MSPPNLVRYSFFIAIKYISIALMVIFFIVPHITHANEIMYGIQVDEFNDSNSAENRVKALNQLGHNAFYRCESIENNKMLCRVFIDQYPTQKEAENEAEFLKKLELITNYSIRQIGEKVQTVKPDTVKPPAPKPKVSTENILIEPCFFSLLRMIYKPIARNRAAMIGPIVEIANSSGFPGSVTFRSSGKAGRIILWTNIAKT